MPDFMEVVSVSPLGDGVTDLSTSYPEFAGRDAVLGEYASLFALRRLLQDARSGGRPPAADDMVAVSHYRRFAVTRATGKRSFVYGTVRPEEFARLPRSLFVPPPGTVLFPMPIQVVPNLLVHYASFHRSRDLLFFMALAVDLGLVTNEQAAKWISGRVMVPAPAVGVYPENWLVETLTALESVVDAFESTVAVAREGYQRRAIAFCLERLHGLLLSTLIESWPQDKSVANPALVVSPDGVYHPGGVERAS
jgi:hypothetical protein